MSLDAALKQMINDEVDRQLEEKLPAIIRALGIREAERQETDGLVDALEVARYLGRDLSSPEKIVKAKKHVYSLAGKNLIPSIRISDRNLRFDMAEVIQALKAKRSKAA